MGPVKSVIEFIEQIENIKTPPGHTVVFRGHADAQWKPRPRVLRSAADIKIEEKDLIRKAISRHPAEFDSEKSTFDILTKLQHYGIPTRLLDVTSNPLIALYFALEPIGSIKDIDGSVLVISVPPEAEKYYDSDTVSCLANIANLSGDEQKQIANYKSRSVAEFNDTKVVGRLLQFIRSEKPYFLPQIQQFDLFSRIHVLPKLRNARIIAQNGSFILFGIDRANYVANPKITVANRILISGAHKNSIKEELYRIGISLSYLFPEIDKIASDIIR